MKILMRSLVKPHTSPSPSSPPLKGGEILQPSPLEGEGEGEGALLMNSLASEVLGLAPGKDVYAVIKASNVMIAVD